MTLMQKRVVLILAGVLIAILVFFFVYQPNTEETTTIQASTAKLQSEVNYLTALQIQVDQMKETSAQKQTEMDSYFAEYPSRMTEQKGIFNVYQLMVDTGVKITSIRPALDQKFYENGAFNVAGSEGEAAPVDESGEPVSGSSVEISPETKVPVRQIIGKVTPYELTLTGTKKQLLKAFDWVTKNTEHMSIGGMSFSYDSSNGKLTGTMAVQYYSMNGNGVPYVEPDISGINIGSDNVFGTFKK